MRIRRKDRSREAMPSSAQTGREAASTTTDAKRGGVS